MIVSGFRRAVRVQALSARQRAEGSEDAGTQLHITRRVLHPLDTVAKARMLALHRSAPHACRVVASARSFHFTRRLGVKVGDGLPDVELMEGSPGTKVNLAKELSSGRGVIVGVPAAYSNNAPVPPLEPC